MNRIIITFYSLILYFSCAGLAQTDKYKGESFLFKDLKTNQAVVIENDSLYYRNSPETKRRLLHTSYPEIISRYQAFYIKGKNYFAQNGCGPVLEWRNDSLVRIDNSFLHQNQFGAATFVYQNEIYYFGGYGLFTFKNILTKYSFKSREWMAVQTFGNEFPSLRRGANRILIKDQLYIFGGLSENPDSFYFGQVPSDNLVWKLDLTTLTWSKEGVFDSKYNSAEGYYNFQKGSIMYMISRADDNKIYEIDILNNTVKKYVLPSLIVPKSIYFDEKTNEIVVLHFLSTKASSKIIRLKLDAILKNPVEREPFVTHPFSKWLTIVVLLAGIMLLIFIVYSSKIKRKIREQSHFLYDSKANHLIFKGKKIDAFDSNEMKIISHLLSNQANYIPLSSLNNLFEQQELVENYASTTKRREITLNAIISKLSLISGCKEVDILLYRKNPDDKRMKEIKLKDHFIVLK